MCKKFSSQIALDNIQLEIRQGEFFSLLGPSGCGKTTLLRIIAGFENPSSGELYWDTTRIDQIKPQERPFNMVFQKYGLFPHLSVFENVAYGLKIKKVQTANLNKRVNDTLELVGLTQFKDRYPETLSGGQAQRVAVARAIVNEPKILLLDEPLSALDLKMREHMQTELRALQRRMGITFILVTHDQEEALALSDRIGVMNHGVLEQVSAPQELYESPKSYFVAQFVGGMGSICGVGANSSKAGCAELLLSNRQSLLGRGSVRKDSHVEAFVRPDKIKLKSFEGANHLQLEVKSVVFRGYNFEVMLAPKGLDVIFKEASLRALLPTDDVKEISQGQMLDCYFSSQDTFVFERPIA
jgi:spermidine/putrescine transport system ATP-binding protein